MTNMGYLTMVTVTSSSIVFEPAASHNKCCTTGWYVLSNIYKSKACVPLLFLLLVIKLWRSRCFF